MTHSYCPLVTELRHQVLCWLFTSRGLRVRAKTRVTSKPVMEKPSSYQEWKTIFIPGRRILLKAGTYTRSRRLSISRFPPCGSLYVKVAWDSGVIHKGTPRMLDSRQLLSGRWQEGRAAGSSGNLSVKTELVTHVQLLQLVVHPQRH